MRFLYNISILFCQGTSSNCDWFGSARLTYIMSGAQYRLASVDRKKRQRTVHGMGSHMRAHVPPGLVLDERSHMQSHSSKRSRHPIQVMDTHPLVVLVRTAGGPGLHFLGFLQIDAMMRLASCTTELHKLVLPAYIPKQLWPVPVIMNWTSDAIQWRHALVRRILVTEMSANVTDVLSRPNSVTELVVSPTVSQSGHTAVIQSGVDWMPSTVTTLTFGERFNQCVRNHSVSLDMNHTLSAVLLPPTLTHLTFDLGFNQSLGTGMLPRTLTHLIFCHDSCFNQSLSPGVFPASLTVLIFGQRFDQPLVPNVLPVKLKKLKFGYRFNHPLNPHILPPNLTHLTFGSSGRFDQPLLRHAVPMSLTHLRLGYGFIKSLRQSVVPGPLDSLRVGEYWDQPLAPSVTLRTVYRVIRRLREDRNVLHY
jgi:hypothetical protein